MSYRKSLKSCVLATSSAAVIGAALAAGAGAPALAQEATDDRVVVTGSRIARRDFQANSPIVTVDTEQFEQQSGLNIESYLNQLPQFNPAAAPTISGGEGGNSDVQITGVRSVGIATVSLRGLGANRNLVLIDGHRPTPINALMVTDINAIPSALIQRTEIITGGASAVYGADAVGGVVNFILRDDFEGFELDTQYGITEASDGEEFRISAVMGSNFANGRGNVSIGAEHYTRAAALDRNREFFTDAWSDPSVGGDFRLYGVNEINFGFAPPAVAATDVLFAGRPTGSGSRPFGSSGIFLGYQLNPDGTVWYNGPATYKTTVPVDGSIYAYQDVYDPSRLNDGTVIQQLKWNNRYQYTSSPQDRYSLFASGNYDITDSIEFFMRGTWAESKTKTLLLPAGVQLGWEARIPYQDQVDSPVDPTLDYTDPAVVAAVLANPSAFANPTFLPTGHSLAQHPVPVEVAVLLNSRGPYSPTGTGARYSDWVPQIFGVDSLGLRRTVNTNTTWQFETGLRGELPFRDWTWEAYVSHGESSTYNLAYGNRSLERVRALIQAPDYGRGEEFAGNEESFRTNFGAAFGTCTTGYYDTIFSGDVAPSADCDYLSSAILQSRTQNQQNIGELNMQGGLFELPAGELRAAVGFQYRENSAQFYPDILQSTASFNDQVIGVYPTAYLDASTYVRESYGELLVPILSDLPFIQQFNLELGARYSDYEYSPNEWTYKILGEWTINDWLRLRGGYNRATRAPNLGELFLNEQELFAIGGNNFSDPCSFRSTAPYGAGGAGADPVITTGEQPTSLAFGQTAAGAQSTYLICQAQMGATGAATYYAANQVGGGGGLFNWIYQKGNPDLDSEKADTWTFGAVIQSPFDNPWLSGLSATIDWYQLEITDAIQQYSIDYARYLCYGTNIVSSAADAAAQAASTECQNVGRTQNTGGVDNIFVAYDNQATIETSGVDVALNWTSQFEDVGIGLPGGLGLNLQASILDYYRTKQSPLDFDVEVDWAGSLGPTLAGTNAGAYDYRIFGTLSYFLEGKSVSLRWRHLPEVVSATKAQQLSLIENNANVAAGGSGAILSYTPTTDLAIESYDIFDLSFSWDLNETWSLRGGVNNLFDTDPSLTGRDAGRVFGTDLSAVCSTADEALGCVDPGGYSLPSSGAGMTNGGFYDTLGRRYFLGVKARF